MAEGEHPAGETTTAELVAAGLLLNLAWEYAHWPLYGCPQRRPCCRAPMTAGAAAADAGLILAVHALGAWLFRDRRWTRNLDDWKILFTVATGVLMAVGIEKVALSRRWWEYHERMPLLPRIGVGLLPILQMAALPLLTFRLLQRRQP